MPYDWNQIRLSARRLGRDLASERARYCLSLRDVARQTGVSPATLSRIEAGRTPDLETFFVVALWLARTKPEPDPTGEGIAAEKAQGGGGGE